MTKGYYVNLEGAVITVTEKGGKNYNPWGEVMLDDDSVNGYVSVYEGGWEDGGFRMDEEYVLWTSLKELSEAVEGI